MRACQGQHVVGRRGLRASFKLRRRRRRRFKFKFNLKLAAVTQAVVTPISSLVFPPTPAPKMSTARPAFTTYPSRDSAQAQRTARIVSARQQAKAVESATQTRYRQALVASVEAEIFEEKVRPPAPSDSKRL